MKDSQKPLTDAQLEAISGFSGTSLLGLQDLIVRGRETYPDVYKKWVEVDQRLSKWRGDVRGHAFVHLDANIDLMLRCIEEEQREVMSRLGSNSYATGGVLFGQISLSKGWILSTYEIVRQTHETKCKVIPGKDICGKNDCFRCSKLKPLKEDFSAVRMPLAKLQPESRTKCPPSQTNYYPAFLIENETGSIGWKVMSDKLEGEFKLSRIGISNDILKLCD
jgi:hypothetical protein